MYNDNIELSETHHISQFHFTRFCLTNSLLSQPEPYLLTLAYIYGPATVRLTLCDPCLPVNCSELRASADVTKPQLLCSVEWLFNTLTLKQCYYIVDTNSVKNDNCQ